MKKILFILISVIISATAHAQNWSVSSGTEIPFLVGETGGLIAGQAVYLNQLTKKVYKAEITGSKKEAIGFCSKTAAVNDTTYIVTGGLVLTWPDTLTVGAVYYLSETTAGAIRNTKPTGTYQAVGVAVDTHKMQVVIAPVRIEPATTPGLDAVTAIGSTSYNDITVSDGAFNVLTLAGTDTARIRFTDPVGEGTADLVGPPKGTMDGILKWQFPNKSGTVAVLDDVGLNVAAANNNTIASGTQVVFTNGSINYLTLNEQESGYQGISMYDENTERNVLIRRPSELSSNRVLLLPDESGTFATKKYKSYVAYISQTGTADPDATVIYNDFGDTPVWARVTTGEYNCTLTGFFTEGQTVIICDKIFFSADLTSEYNYSALRASDNVINLNSGQSGSKADNSINGLLFEIRIYN